MLIWEAALERGVQMAVGLWNLEMDPFVSPKRWFVSLTRGQGPRKGHQGDQEYSCSRWDCISRC